MIHTLKDKADWEYISPKDYNAWQKIAANTRGFVTPGNLASLLGLFLVLLGLGQLLHEHYFLGAVLLGAGRLCDLLDGTLAEYTGTKCQVGEILDTGADKVAIFFAATVIAFDELTPAYIIWSIIGINLASVAISAIARVRRITIHPSASGKFFTALSWVALIAYLYSYALDGTAQAFVRVIAYACFVGTVLLGAHAVYGYSRKALARKPTLHKVILYDRIIVVQNPKSSHAKRVERRIKELQRLYGKENITTITTTTNAAIYDKQLRKKLLASNGKTLLCIGGGDGTVHHAVNSIVKDSGLKSIPITILPLWGGNANDFGYMLNGLSVNKTLKMLMKRGHEIAIHPLEITLKTGKKSVTTYAVCYASFGASAYAAHHLDTIAVSRKGPLHSVPVLLMAREAFQVLRALLQAPTFKADINGERVDIFEQVFTNGSRIAKINRLPVRLHEKQYYRATQPDKHPSFLIRIFKIIRGKQVGITTNKPHSFTTAEPILGQFDGEVRKIAAHTTITISISKKSLIAFTTKLS